MKRNIVGQNSAGLRPTATQLLAERQGPLPVWVRGPARGLEFYSSCSRAKLYQWAADGKIRSVSIREPGRIRGCRLFHLGSILDFIEKQDKEAGL
jgi:hypothetical protein